MFRTSLDFDAASSFGTRLCGMGRDSEASHLDSKEKLKAAVLALVDEFFSQEHALHHTIETDHGFSVRDEEELKNLPPLKPGWKVARFIEKADYGEGHDDPGIDLLYVALPLEGKFIRPNYDRDAEEVNVRDYKNLTVCFYRKRQVIRLPEDSFVYRDGRWEPIVQIE